MSTIQLYLNAIGGHSILFEYNKEYILKTVSDKEKNSYIILNILKDKDNTVSRLIDYLPKVYINNILNHENFDRVEIFKKTKMTIKKYIIKNNIDITEVNIEDKYENSSKKNEKNEEFIKEWMDFLNSHKENDKIDVDYDNIDIELYDKLNLISESKLNWILFWFIKWSNKFINKDMILMENLTFKNTSPIIFDFKLGVSEKPHKDMNELNLKIKDTTTYDYNYRLMGVQLISKQNKSLEVINKYQCREMKVLEIKKVLKENLIILNNTDFILYLISKVKEILEIVRLLSKKVNFQSFSLLIIIKYDEISDFLNCRVDSHSCFSIDDYICIKIIDLGYCSVDTNDNFDSSEIEKLYNQYIINGMINLIKLFEDVLIYYIYSLYIIFIYIYIYVILYILYSINKYGM